LWAFKLNAGANSSLILRCHERTMSAPIFGRVRDANGQVLAFVYFEH